MKKNPFRVNKSLFFFYSISVHLECFLPACLKSDIFTQRNTQKHLRNNGAIVSFGRQGRHTRSFKSRWFGKGKEKEEEDENCSRGSEGRRPRGRRQGGIPRELRNPVLGKLSCE